VVTRHQGWAAGGCSGSRPGGQDEPDLPARHGAAAARSYLVETLPIPLLAISATVGLFSMYHDKRPRSTTSGKALKSSTSAQQKDAHES